LIQIGVKSEFRQNLGRVGLFYGNKTQYALHSFQPQLSWTDENQAKLAVQVKPVDPILEAGAQIQQMINAECIDDYNGTFLLRYFYKFLLINIGTCSITCSISYL